MIYAGASRTAKIKATSCSQRWDDLASRMIRTVFKTELASIHKSMPSICAPRSRRHYFVAATPSNRTHTESLVDRPNGSHESSQTAVSPLSDFLSQSGSSAISTPYETIADSFLWPRQTELKNDTRLNPSSIERGLVAHHSTPCTLMEEAVSSRNPAQVWHTYNRVLPEQRRLDRAPFSASTFYRIMACLHSQKSRAGADHVWKVYHDLVTFYNPHINTFNMTLEMMFRNKSVTEIRHFFDSEVKRFNLQPTAWTYNVWIKGLGMNGHVQEAMDTYQQMRSGGICVKPDLATYSTIMAVHIEDGRMQGAAEVIADMVHDQVQPNIFIYNTVMKSYIGQGDLVGARKILQIMRDTNHLPGVATYSMLLGAYAKQGDVGGITKVQSEMAAEGIVPNARAVTSTLEIYSKVYLDRNIDHDLEQLLKRHPEGEMSEYTYGVLMNVYGKRMDLSTALATYQYLQTKNRPINDVIINSLLDGHVRANQVPMANELFRNHFTLCQRRPDSVWTYSIMISGSCQSGNLEDALYYYGEMHDFGMEPNAIIYSRLIQLFLSQSQIDEADRILKRMQLQHLEISPHTFTMLMDFCAKRRDLKGVMQYYQRMTDAGVEPDIHCYTVLINAHLNVREWEGCDVIYNRMLERSILPTLETFTSMMKAYSDQGNFAKARKFWDIMRQAGHKPDRDAYTTLMHTFGQQGNVEMVELVRERMQEQNIELDAVAYAALVRTYGQLPVLNIRRLEEIVEMLEEQGPIPRAYIVYDAIMEAFGSHRLPDRVIKIWKQFTSPDHKEANESTQWVPTDTNLLHLIEACRDRGYMDVLQSVWKTTLMRNAESPSHFGKETYCMAPPEVLSAYIDALMTHNRFRDVEQLFASKYLYTDLKPTAKDLTAVFSGLAQYEFLQKDLVNMRSVVIRRWPSLSSEIDNIIQSTRKI